MNFMNFLIGGTAFDYTAVTAMLSSGDALLIDVRTPAEYNAGHAKGAINMTLGSIDAEALKNKKVFVICASGGRSSMATAQLKLAGIDATNIPGGTAKWMLEGLPME